MTKCSKCGEEIDELLARGSVPIDRRISLSSDGSLNWGEADTDFDEVFEEYVCPECGEVLFKDQLKAIAFLEGEVQ
jgi:predicted RNA-binding Zn-ribbon protein involved in translation (DUF1610 family)